MNGDARDLAHCVGPALEMLDVDRCVNVASRLQDIQHVLMPFGVARAGDVGVGQFIDENEIGPSPQNRFEVHLFQPRAAIFNPAARDDLQPVQQQFGLLPAVGFDVADDHIDTFRL